MFKDSLGDRMKHNYEAVTKTRLIRRMPAIIRLDGCHFHTFCKGFKKPFDALFAKTMQATMKYLCENIQGCVLGYTQSDEITLILIDYKQINSSAWFDNEVQKICSVSASLATYAFNKYFNEFYLEQIAEKCEIDEYDLIYDKARKNGAYFDSRVFNVPKEEVTNCLLWRQLDAERNSILCLGQSLFTHKEIERLNIKDLKTKIENEKGVIWGNLPTPQKRGSCCIKQFYFTDKEGKFIINENETHSDIENGGYGIYDKQTNQFLGTCGCDNDTLVLRACWMIDQDIPRFIDSGRDYIERLL